MVAVYRTPFDPKTKRCTGPSVDAGHPSLSLAAMFEPAVPVHAGPRTVVYADYCLSDFVLSLDAHDNSSAPSAALNEGVQS